MSFEREKKCCLIRLFVGAHSPMRSFFYSLNITEKSLLAPLVNKKE
jgi:hypothetical protein